MSTIYHDKNEKSVGLRFLGKYSFPNSQAGEIKNGDFFTVQAPSQLGVQDATLVLRDPDTNEILGSAKVNRHTHIITFTFNEKVDGRQNVRGDFVVFAYEQVTKETKTITYTLPGGKTQTVTFAVKDQVIIPVEGDLLSKNAWNSRDPQIGWNVRINRSKMNLNGHTIKIKDKLNSSSGAYMSYIENTFELHEAKYESTNTNQAGLVEKTEKYEVTTDPEKYRANSDKMAYLKFVDGKQGFELLMPTNTGDKSFFLFYYTTSPTDTSTVRNSAQFLIDNEPQIVVKQWGGETRTDKEAIGRLKTVKTESATCTTDIAGKIKITKYDEDDTIVKLAGIEFDILKKDTEEVVQTVKTDENGIALTKALSDGKYIVKEKSPKSG
ncbi:SpaA isopeptide-forming pilin-related protein, partial [Streptococcus constellatus]|uniref:SpaA isopeptide-forming pilin-related protein n=1 Tax=Streptococcus constellatus TaxID=76860 RepID=UPI0021B41D92